MYLAVGGAPEFNDSERAIKEIDATLKKLKKKPKDIKVVYGIGKMEKAGEGGFFYAQQWAESNGVLFRSGEPKWDEHGKNAVERRNKALVENCNGFILFVKGNSNGGNSIVQIFEQEKVPIYRIEQGVTKKDPLLARKIYGAIAKRLLETSVTLDVETTGLSEVDDEIVELAVVNAKTGKAMFDSFVHTDVPVGDHAFVVNGITPEMLAGQPDFATVWQKAQAKIGDKIIIASNSDFDEKMVCFGLAKRGLPVPSNLWTCLQQLYSKYSCQPRKGLKTERIARQLGIEPGTHRALADCQAQAAILKAMAKGVVPDLSI
jgi:DNA polymerase III epsilon subunit-like protein